MVLGKGALAVEGGHDRDLEQLRELSQLVPGLGLEGALPGQDDRRLGREQGVDRLGDIPWVALGRRAPLRRVAGREVAALLIENVARRLERDRPRLAVAQKREGVLHHLGDAGHVVDGLRPLGHVAQVGAGLEVGRHAQLVARIARRQMQDGTRVAIGLGDGAEGVLRARTALHGDDTDAPAVVHAAEAVRHVDGHTLGAGEDGADAARRRGVDDLAVGEAGQVLDPLFLEDSGDDVAALHGSLLRKRGKPVGIGHAIRRLAPSRGSLPLRRPWAGPRPPAHPRARATTTPRPRRRDR